MKLYGQAKRSILVVSPEGIIEEEERNEKAGETTLPLHWTKADVAELSRQRPKFMETDITC